MQRSENVDYGALQGKRFVRTREATRTGLTRGRRTGGQAALEDHLRPKWCWESLLPGWAVIATRGSTLPKQASDDARMTNKPSHFTQPESEAFLPTRSAGSYWGADHLGGPAVVGLAARTLEHEYGLADFTPARLTVELFKAARAVPTSTSARLVRDGNRVRNAECDIIQGGVAVAHATMAQYRRTVAPPGEQWTATTGFAPPAVAEHDSVRAYVGSDDVGWSTSVTKQQNKSRKRLYHRCIDLLAGEENSPFVNAVMIAEATSLVTNLGTAGVGYINGDLTVALARLPISDWIGVQAESHWAADGVATGTATLFDDAGAFGSAMVTSIANPTAQIDFANTRSRRNKSADL